MAKASIESRTEGRASTPREIAVFVRVSLTITIALLFVLLLDTLGTVTAIDEGLRRQWVTLGESVGASRESSELIVVVAGDRDTVAAWGPPPWPAERLAELVEQIEISDPDLIAELGHTRMFLPGKKLDEIVESRRGELLIQSVDEELVSPWTGVGLEHGDLVLGPNSRLVELAIRSDRLPPMPERLPVNWLTPSSRLPVVPAHQVASGKIPPRTLARRVVLLGITDPAYALHVATPVGPLSPVEIEAHALTGLADNVVWAEVPRVWSYLGCGLLALVLLWLFKRTAGSEAVIVVLTSAILILLADFIAYERGWVRLGSGLALLTLMTIWLTHWLSEAVASLAGLRQLRARVLRATAGSVTDVREQEIEEAGFWDHLASLGAEYAQEVLGGPASSTVLERQANSLHLQVRSSARLDSDSQAYIIDREHLDIRRAPFRAAWLTLRASWTTELLPDGTLYGGRKSLIVPLEHDGELVGLWLVHMPARVEVEREDSNTFERLGQQMAEALIRRRQRQTLRDQGNQARLRDQVETIVGGLRLLHEEHRWALELLEQLPVRALITTVWGEIEFIDPRLHRDLARRYPGLLSDDMPEHNLRTVLARLTGKSVDEAHRLMRKVVRDGVEIEIDAITGLEAADDDVWVMSRIRSKRGIDLPGFKPAIHEHILLMARSSAPAQTIATRSGGYLRVLGES